MFDLKTAAIGIRKAAALKGIWSGSFIPYSQHHTAAGKAFNNRIPKGVYITHNEVKQAEVYTWSKIKKEMRPWDNCEDVTQEFKEVMDKRRNEKND